VAVNTRRVTNRRKLRYQDLDEFLADAERMRRGPVHTIGNWTLPQIFDHLARSMTASMDGMNVSFPAAARFILKFRKKKILSSPMKPGFRCPRQVELALRPREGLDADKSWADLRAAVSRFKTAPSFADHPAFGKMTRDEWNQIALRHAELHMSFVVPD